MGAGRYLSDEEPEKLRLCAGSELNLGSPAEYGGSFCLLRRLLSSMPRSKAVSEPTNSESSRCAAGKEAGVEYRSASLFNFAGLIWSLEFSPAHNVCSLTRLFCCCAAQRRKRSTFVGLSRSMFSGVWKRRWMYQEVFKIGR
jgi:hypothetical protein